LEPTRNGGQGDAVSGTHIDGRRSPHDPLWYGTSASDQLREYARRIDP
jgi:hypothetical protein